MTGDTDHLIIAQITADLPHDHRHGIGGKTNLVREVKVIDRLDQSDTADLKQVVHVLTAGRKPLYDG